jgi:DNA-binding NarL/FixJ family response regulator
VTEFEVEETAQRAIRVVVADDDPFTVSLVAGGLEARGYSVLAAESPDAAWQLVDQSDPHVLVTDLDFGGDGSGVDLIDRVHREHPWIGVVVLTAHRSPQLAVDDPSRIPGSVVYLVKSSLRSVDDLAAAVQQAIAGGDGDEEPEPRGDDIVALTPGQADVLRMLASGASTKALAEQRGTTVRAAETMLTRLYQALGLEITERSNPRVEAVRLWQQGRVTVR